MAEPQPRKRAPLASRRPGQPTTVVRVGPVAFGGARIVLIGGPCAVEGREQILAGAALVAAAGATMLRGGAWKPRTSPYDFQGLGREGLALLAEARRRTGLPVVTEVLDPRDVADVAEVADMLQIGSRSVQNFPLLREAGASGKPVLLKRGMMTTVDEWLSAAEHVLAAGGRDLVFCERGIRTFEPALRNTLDLGSVVVLKERTHLPVIVDPSHAAGDVRYVAALARAAVAAGADGLLIETHWAPADALSDGGQSLDAAAFA
ncbi:MAG: 3-deoxy-7-phosphoheptulonate synthase, partial [Krumholzibacteria bacterium]|nr:3-deoxy-7-phosphoheptulonate synthase [Candidatus Krumholzibacteria bacterium]